MHPTQPTVFPSHRLPRLAVAACALLLALGPVRADSIWACVDQVSQDSYSGILNNYLHTHAGDNRDNHTPAWYDAQANIITLFQSYGLTTTLDSGVYSGYTYNNVMGVHAGTGSQTYVIGAHYDSVGNPGADDNASGVAGMLEAARILSQYRSDATIVFVAFDREEDGLWGSRGWVANHTGWDIRGMVSMDMIAYNPAGPTQDQARLFGRTASDPWKSSLATALATYGGVSATLMGQFDASDHAPFEWQGDQAALLIEYNYSTNPYYHRAGDNVDTPGYIDYAYASDMTRGVVGLIADKADSYAPEPATTTLMASSLLTLGLRLRGRRRVRVTLLRFPGR